MKLLVRQFVKNLEAITGYKFSWMAVTHTDMGHIHSHLLINGIDRKLETFAGIFYITMPYILGVIPPLPKNEVDKDGSSVTFSSSEVVFFSTFFGSTNQSGGKYSLTFSYSE